jgi:hypothetical protein
MDAVVDHIVHATGRMTDRETNPLDGPRERNDIHSGQAEYEQEQACLCRREHDLRCLRQPRQRFAREPERIPGMRVCVCCQRRLGQEDLLDRESKRMEQARVSMGLEGVRFRYYTCPRCGHDHVFLEIVPLPGETSEELHCRKKELATDVEDVRAFRTTVLVVEQGI